MSNEHDNGTSLLERDLQKLRRPHEHDEVFRTELRHALDEAARSSSSRLRFPSAFGKTPRTRRLALLMATVVGVSLAGSIFGYVQLTGSTQLTGPAPASAATVLRDVAASSPGAGEVAHYRYTFTVRVPAPEGGSTSSSVPRPSPDAAPPGDSPSPGSSAEPVVKDKGGPVGTVEVWIAGGDPGRSSQTVTLAKSSGAPEGLLGRFIQVGGATYGYDATHEALTLPSEPNAAPAIVLPNEAYDGASLAQSIEQLAARGSRVVALARQTLEGVPVNVIQADGVLDRPALRITLYFDAQSNILRGFDAVSIDPSYPAPAWQVRLQTASTLRAASAPAGTFSLQPPASTKGVAFRPNKLALPSECGAAKPASATSSLLAACQVSAPSLTAAQLAAVLSQAPAAELRQAVADGVLTTVQASTAVGQIEAQFIRTVTATGAPSPGPETRPGASPTRK